MKTIWICVSTVAAALLITGCSPKSGSKPYTGRFKIDAGTEYVAMEVPSSIGGACSGWQAVEIRKPGQSATGMNNIICWKRDGDAIVITSHDGAKKTSGPMAVWSD